MLVIGPLQTAHYAHGQLDQTFLPFAFLYVSHGSLSCKLPPQLPKQPVLAI